MHASSSGMLAPGRGGTGRLASFAKALGRTLRTSVLIVLVLWGSLAIYFSNLPWPSVRLLLAISFAAFAIWSLWLVRDRGLMAMLAALFVGILIWWVAIPATHNRIWRPDVAVMPRVKVSGDRVVISGFRNFDYRTLDDFTARYETREVQLSHLTGIDFYISYWMPGPIGHTFLSFTFDNAEPVSVSIEARPESHEGYAPIASLFKQFELIYVVGDERDLVRVRTNLRGEDVYLFRVDTTPQNARRLFLVYLERINELADQAEFYHLLSNSCTVNIVRYANVAGRQGRADLRHYLNGLIDGYLYDTNRLNTSLPLDELRRRSHINAAAIQAGDDPNFHERIRAAVPAARP
jgi:hypothetical protein